ncbi:Uncharacterized protein FWK35_00009520 [Aphis craccivora]|uniref:Uncharacterized protein n=1 Tax=Aphis craccivora TaxID=307492 RepID=A0A6G0YV96_APHCR|nr:Uncharacterized protein FWK35_00009520 [Aphis craccivora]
MAAAVLSLNSRVRSSHNSERSDECIDILMMWGFFFITSRNNTPISNFGGGFRYKSEYPWCIMRSKVNIFRQFSKKIEKNKKKKDGKTGIFTQNQYSTKSIFFYGCNSKTNHCKYTSLLTVPYEFSNFYEICRKRENVQYKSVDKIFLAQSTYLKI